MPHCARLASLLSKFINYQAIELQSYDETGTSRREEKEKHQCRYTASKHTVGNVFMLCQICIYRNEEHKIANVIVRL